MSLIPLFAQESNKKALVDQISTLYLRLGDTYAKNDKNSMQIILDSLKRKNIQFNHNIKYKGDFCSLNGHLIFDTMFVEDYINNEEHSSLQVDSLYNKHKELLFSQQLSQQNKGRFDEDRVFSECLCIKAKGRIIYEFDSRDEQIIQVIANPNGRISLKIFVQDKNGKILKTDHDTEDPKIGRRYRKHILQLPHKPISTILIEIINCTNKDTHFAIITN